MHKWLIVFLLTAAVGLAGCTTTTKVVTAGPQSDIVTVTGTGSALSAPDRAQVRFGVTAKDADPRAALRKASEVSKKVNDALKKAGIAEKDLRTGSVNLSPQYTYPRDEAPRITGYNASIDVSAKTKDVAKVGDVIVAGTQAGATTVSGISFDLEDTNPARYEASVNAVKDARRRAEAVAEAAGRALGTVISIGQPQPTTNGAEYQRGMYDGYAAKDAFAVPVQPGQLTAGESVTVVFALK